MILKAPIDRQYESLNRDNGKKLTLFFATLCVIDLFGVFPIVTLPRSLISCGFYGLPLILLVFSLQTYTAVVLGRCWIIAEKLDPGIVDKSRYAYAAIGEMTFGAPMKLFVTILLDLTVFGAGIPNLLVASQNLQLLGLRITNGSFDFSFCYFLIIIGLFLCPIMWLGSPKNMRYQRLCLQTFLNLSTDPILQSFGLDVGARMHIGCSAHVDLHLARNGEEDGDADRGVRSKQPAAAESSQGVWHHLVPVRHPSDAADDSGGHGR